MATPENVPSPTTSAAKFKMIQVIAVSVITAISGAAAGHFAVPVDPQKQQGVKGLALEGKWKYMCTDGKGTYEHGGRFEISKDKNGALSLRGERMFRDTVNPLTHQWVVRDFPDNQYLEWDSDWIFVHDDIQMNFQYTLTSNSLIRGYCTGSIKKNADNEAREVDGHFYQLYPARNLSGGITFSRIDEAEYAKPTWNRVALRPLAQ